jgi:anti-sigma regulatory factor (Ser/Thr protein kinase)
VAAPLRARGQVLGVLALFQGPSGRRFGEESRAWMEDLATRAATALDNARLYRDRAHVARTLQRSLLPPANPAIPGLEIATRYHPVSEGSKVGGDFYDVFPLDRDRWGVVMGDVSGKGVAAASLTALSRYTVRAAALHLDKPSSVLHTLNRAILDGDFEERFCTIVYCSVEERDGGARLMISRGGHPPPLLIGRDGAVSQVDGEGTAMGLFPEPDLVDTQLDLGPGETLVLYTDGLLDARSPSGIWGEDLLESVLAGGGELETDELAEALARSVMELSEGAPRDDVAILVLRMPAEQRVGQVIEELLPPEPIAAVRGRGLVRAWLEECPRDDDILLVVTELISNAARVARNEVALRTWRTPSAVMVEVADDGEGFAPHTDPGAVPSVEQESGRGLFLVNALADDVQITSTSSGTAVRCKLELTNGR